MDTATRSQPQHRTPTATQLIGLELALSQCQFKVDIRRCSRYAGTLNITFSVYPDPGTPALHFKVECVNNEIIGWQALADTVPTPAVTASGDYYISLGQALAQLGHVIKTANFVLNSQLVA